MKDIGNQCDAHFELNDIPCSPGSKVVANNGAGNGGTWACDTEPGELWDGREAAFGTSRQCFSMPQLQTGDTIITGAMQSLIHTTDWAGNSVVYNDAKTAATLPEWQCQDCPEL